MILMDTHIWLRWILPNDPLSDNHLKLINSSDSLAVSSICILFKFRGIEKK